jgi:hypothetical protein
MIVRISKPLLNFHATQREPWAGKDTKQTIWCGGVHARGGPVRILRPNFGTPWRKHKAQNSAHADDLVRGGTESKISPVNDCARHTCFSPDVAR